LETPISITQISSVSALGNTLEEVWKKYTNPKLLFNLRQQNWVSLIDSEVEKQITTLQHSNSIYKNLDRSVLLALYAAKKININTFKNKEIGVNIGSSRGATSLFEKYYNQFLKEGKVSPFSSPTTTLGNISSWIGQALGFKGIHISHSVTCSTALHAMLNGIAWLKADMAEAFLVGGSEAALTPFTLAQVKAMKLYSQTSSKWICQSMNFQKVKNTMILGEGASLMVLEKGISKNTKAIIKGYGYASEQITHNSSISENAICFQKSMQIALEQSGVSSVDVIVMHAPGTIKGDLAEKNAIDIVFGKQLPLLTSNKWLVGHTFGASGGLSIEMAILMLQHNYFVKNPFYKNTTTAPEKLKTIMINAVGFGGNAVSIILSK